MYKTYCTVIQCIHCACMQYSSPPISDYIYMYLILHSSLHCNAIVCCVHQACTCKIYIHIHDCVSHSRCVGIRVWAVSALGRTVPSRRCFPARLQGMLSDTHLYMHIHVGWYRLRGVTNEVFSWSLGSTWTCQYPLVKYIRLKTSMLSKVYLAKVNLAELSKIKTKPCQTTHAGILFLKPEQLEMTIYFDWAL